MAVLVGIDNTSGKDIAVTGTALRNWPQTLEPAPPKNRKFKSCQLPNGDLRTAKAE